MCKTALFSIDDYLLKKKWHRHEKIVSVPIKICKANQKNYALRITHLTLFLSPNKLAGLFIGEMMFKTVNYPCVLTAANIKTVALCKGEHLLC